MLLGFNTCSILLIPGMVMQFIANDIVGARKDERPQTNICTGYSEPIYPFYYKLSKSWRCASKNIFGPKYFPYYHLPARTIVPKLFLIEFNLKPSVWAIFNYFGPKHFPSKTFLSIINPHLESGR